MDLLQCMLHAMQFFRQPVDITNGYIGVGDATQLVHLIWRPLYSQAEAPRADFPHQLLPLCLESVDE
jgi:hypothetical protein